MPFFKTTPPILLTLIFFWEKKSEPHPPTPPPFFSKTSKTPQKVGVGGWGSKTPLFSLWFTQPKHSGQKEFLASNFLIFTLNSFAMLHIFCKQLRLGILLKVVYVFGWISILKVANYQLFRPVCNMKKSLQFNYYLFLSTIISL